MGMTETETQLAVLTERLANIAKLLEEVRREVKNMDQTYVKSDELNIIKWSIAGHWSTVALLFSLIIILYEALLG